MQRLKQQSIIIVIIIIIIIVTINIIIIVATFIIIIRSLSIKITFRYVVEMNGALGRSEIAIEYRQWGSVQMLEQTNAEMISCIHYYIKIGYA